MKKFFITTKQTLIKDVIIEWNMEWLAERIKIKNLKNIHLFVFIYFIYMHLFICCVGLIARYLYNGCLKFLKITRIVAGVVAGVLFENERSLHMLMIQPFS